jgi:hypothetical protein
MARGRIIVFSGWKVDTYQEGFWHAGNSLTCTGLSTTPCSPANMSKAQNRGRYLCRHGFLSCTASKNWRYQQTIIYSQLRKTCPFQYARLQLPRPKRPRRIFYQLSSKVTLDAAYQVVILRIGSFTSSHNLIMVSVSNTIILDSRDDPEYVILPYRVPGYSCQ